MSKVRVDERMVQLGLAESRSKACALILSGSVYAEGRMVAKAGTRVAESVELEVRAKRPCYVSRGGTKLEGALDAFALDVSGLTALDVGASTGGFTDCLLKRGVRRVFAVDVGHGQLDWTLRNDPRVEVFEKVNARFLTEELLGATVDAAFVDVSFISLSLVIPAVLSVVNPGGIVLALIKPQFEVGKGEVGKGGVVRDPEKHARVVRTIEDLVVGLNCSLIGVSESSLPGPKGNKEFFIAFRKQGV